MCGTTVGASSLQLNVSAPSHVCIELSVSEASRIQILQASKGHGYLQCQWRAGYHLNTYLGMIGDAIDRSEAACAPVHCC